MYTLMNQNSCPKVHPGKLNIHMVAHTHDDVGWLKTVDQYYYGSRQYIQKAGVQFILDSVIEALLQNPERRFIYAETAFFWKWWLHQNEKVKTSVKHLVDEGRLEFIGGAWTMNDEAVTYYQSTIDQFTWGLRLLNDTFGECGRPKIGWQIDPFGHAKEQASMFTQMGYDGLLFGRLDYADKKKRLQEKNGELIWKSNPSLGDDADLFTSVLFHLYQAPTGFCFDVLCKDEVLIEDPDSPEYNIDTKVEEFLAAMRYQSESYKTNNIIITMGGDFNYQHAQLYFGNMDILIRNINARNGSDYNIIYSTPACYLKALNDLNETWPIKNDDFFPYASDKNSYWTGYYTSRPALKFFERLGNNFLQVVKQMSALHNLASDHIKLDKFREAMGVLQHHDAVTGTEKQHVANDYAQILHKSIKGAEEITSRVMRGWLKKEKSSSKLSPEFHSCLLLNISACYDTENNKNFVVTLYNPTSQPLKTYVRIPVSNTGYTVKNYLGTEILTQVVPVPLTVERTPGRESKARFELIFSAIGTPPLGFQSFYISEINRKPLDEANNYSRNETATFIGSDMYHIYVDKSGNIKIQSKLKKNLSFKQSFSYYEGSSPRTNFYPAKNSGAYIFRPMEETEAVAFNYTGSYSIFKGPLVEELHININNWISQVVRVYSGQNRIEFNWLVGPINTTGDVGREVVTRYTTNLKSEEIFYTDSNGRQMIKRKRNFRPTWNQTFHEPISSNYYPITTKVYLQDSKSESKMTVLTDRSEGVTSLKDGELELMLHRRCLMDDGFGVLEALDEQAFGEGLVVQGQHSILLGNNSDESVVEEKNQALQTSLKPWIFITPIENISFEDWKNNFNMKAYSLNKAVPRNVHILTLEPWKDDSILLRLEHIFEIGESVKYSIPVQVNIKDLFSEFTIVSIKETNLSGNQWRKDVNRMKWQAETENKLSQSEKITVRKLHYRKGRNSNHMNNDPFNIDLKPMEIKTFIVKIALHKGLD
ncbi:lysosomal alpha-mannosidase-like [Belonocnema kinseyi]|uniref:lysosomal alpha-mannosidase-like n=1 Tax=Belonocnema kinseyi TaxID=2817044 RepID=UPI00143D99A6|nr:lysosomal alpha-mannosidase-like [Belonocnema kinseyi]